MLEDSREQSGHPRGERDGDRGPSRPAIADSWLARSAPEVAPELVGCVLVRRVGETVLRGTIVETEAYTADDPACHAYRRQTKRNAAMFGAPGLVYVYQIYGIHRCVNIVTLREGVADAVLIRALQLEACPPDEVATTQRQLDRLAAGPGKLCRVFGIDLPLCGTRLDPAGELWLEARSPEFSDGLDRGELQLVQTARIGITRGVEIPWRWYLKDCPAVSKKG